MQRTTGATETPGRIPPAFQQALLQRSPSGELQPIQVILFSLIFIVGVVTLHFTSKIFS